MSQSTPSDENLPYPGTEKRIENKILYLSLNLFKCHTEKLDP